MISGLNTQTLQRCMHLLFFAVSVAWFSQCTIAAERWQSLAQPVFQTIEHNSRPLEGPIRATAQDRDGYIWLVSDNSLWRWDAYQLMPIPFQTDAAEHSIVPDVQTLKADPDGVLWVGTSKGLYRINQEHLRLERVNVNALKSQFIDLLAFDYHSGNKRVYIGNDFNIIEWQAGTQKTNLLALGANTKNRAFAMLIDANRQLWVGTGDGLMTKSLAEPSNAALRLFKKLPDLDYISALYSDSAQRLWIGSAKSGVYMINRQQEVQHIKLPSNDGSNPWIYDITELRPGIIWFGTFGKGILEYHTANQTFTSIRQQRGLKRNLLDNDIWSFFKDKRGLIWIGGRRGVNMYNPLQSAFKYIPGDMDGPNGLPDSQIYSVLATSDDQLWLGTGSSGIEVIHPEKGRVLQLPAGLQLGASHIPDDAIESMYQKDEQTIFAGSNWDTLQITRKPLSIEALSLPGRQSDAFSSAFTMHGGKLWIGGTDGLWQTSADSQHKAVNVLKKIPGDHRVSTLMSEDQTLWIGTWKGLFTLVEKDGVEATDKITAINDPIITQQFISALVKDSKQRIWVGTYSAGLLYNTAQGIARKQPWQSITEKNGLPGNSISSIQADLEGNLWVATTHGLAHIDVDSLLVVAISPEEGAAAAPYEDGAITVSGEVVFVGNNGVTIVQPGLWRNSPFKAPIIISRIESNSNKPLIARAVKDNDGVWRNKLVVSPDINRLSIEFAALDYVAASHLHYRYRLLGFDSHWIETDAKHRTATFTSLSPQTFEMQVQYSLDGVNWQNERYSLFIDVQPAWYQKPWLHLAVLGLVLFLILLVIQWRTRRTQAYQYLLEQRISERTAELEQANDLLQLQSRAIEEASLTDPLTGLRNRRFFTQHIEADTVLAQRHYLNNYAAPDELRNADLIFFLIDIDHFKMVNDKWGHACGDAVLIEMHHRLTRVFRESDYIVRWGGEEFLAVARGTSRKKAAELAERICQSVSQEAISLGAEQKHSITCSIGYAAYPFFPDQPKAFSWSETLALADAALYSAKQSGRNTWVGFDTDRIHSTSAQASHLKISPKAAFDMDSIRVRKGDSNSMA